MSTKRVACCLRQCDSGSVEQLFSCQEGQTKSDDSAIRFLYTITTLWSISTGGDMSTGTHHVRQAPLSRQAVIPFEPSPPSQGAHYGTLRNQPAGWEPVGFRQKLVRDKWVFPGHWGVCATETLNLDFLKNTPFTNVLDLYLLSFHSFISISFLPFLHSFYFFSSLFPSLPLLPVFFPCFLHTWLFSGVTHISVFRRRSMPCQSRKWGLLHWSMHSSSLSYFSGPPFLFFIG